ncbi:RHS repeat-associated core domain-containing protein [uncultured Chryseobacterium sp.]|uniref:RHS repeat-associated core domain-containing protein n=1 Tax=uncultured Chryseobacterium sp. TaxID=259322 RepID=UPI002582B03F|nr:RHS repeat-associated core domain-containing protein [uncultured Chryseobacterium sp.]
MKKYNYKKIQIFSSLVLSFISIFCLSQNFHDTKGNIEVNRVGQLQFSLPLDLPPGIKTVSPQVGLVYNSETENGIAGYGWSISGITTISRTGKNIENEGEVKGVQMDFSDYYSFNGKRLVLKSGVYGKDGAEYVTEKYSNTKFKSIGTAAGWYGPEYWEVTFEDGSQAWYGRGADSRIPTEYNISEWKDPQGNYISYSYAQGTRTAMISSISWGGNKDLNKPHMNTIQFSYNDRDLKEESYVQGLKSYQNKILSEVKVLTNNNQFKRYSIEYTGNGTNYQFVGKITEYNANNEPANPVTFSYPAMVNSSYAEYTAEPEPFNDVKLVADFNGDSYLDFLMNNGTVKLGAFNETFSTVTTGKTFAGNAKIVSTLLDEEGQVYNGNGIIEYKDSRIYGYIFRNNDFVKVFDKSLGNTVFYGLGDNLILEVGDFNGDGIPDAFLDDGAPAGFNVKGIVDLKNPTTPLISLLLDAGINENDYKERKYLDIDGDGKVEIINVSNTQYTVFEFVKYNATQYLQKIKFNGNLLETKDPEFPVLFGDYNGDGKLDFAIPITDYAIGKPDDWRFYMGTDKGFNPFLKQEFFTYRKFQKEMTGNYAKFAKEYFFSVTDMNKDGKSDIVQVFSYNQINMFNAGGSRDFGYVVSAKMANGSDVNGIPNFTPNWLFQSPTYSTQDLLDLTLFTPITNSIKSGNNYYNVFLYWKQFLKKIKGPTPVSELARITSITQGGVTTNVKYLEVVPGNTTTPDFYKKEKKEIYPSYAMTRVDQAYAVSQLIEEGRKQDFRYRGLVGNLQGKKLFGFQQIARSSWYADGFENTKIWSGSQIDPALDGAPVKEWSIRTNNESNIFPADISENNSQLLSFESVDYKADKLLNGQVITSIPAGSQSKIVTAIVPKFTKTKDFLTGTFTQKSTIYGNYYLPSKIEINTNYGYGVATTEFDYTHNIGGTGNNYYVGRPTNKTEKIEAYGDVENSFTTYTYENNLLKSSQFFPGSNMTQNVADEYSYDGFGNITAKKTISGIDGNSISQKDEYDPTGRFIIKKTDNIGLETGFTYNNLGQVLTQTDPNGNTLTNIYDVWGKLLSSASSLAGTTTYQYAKDNQYNETITRNDPDGDIAKVFTNKLGQEYKKSSKAFAQGQYVSKDVQYDILGRKLKESEAYFEGLGATQWNTFVYDDTVFPVKVKATAFTGKQIETIISGLTTTVKETSPLDYGRTTSQTLDALGNVLSSSDKGGTVQFSYNAAGQQIQAKYAEHIVSTLYDDWGNKTRVEDPSTGVYEYQYLGYMGTLSRVISPKGEKRYQYNNLGQLVIQNEKSTAGNETDKVINFSYDNKGRLTEKRGTSNGNKYTYIINYDPQGRTISSFQDTPEAYFSHKNVVYDSKGRISSYEKIIQTSVGTTSVSVENLYNVWNGELYQVKEKTSGKVLWELKEANAKGLLVKAKLGAAEIVNAYDSNGFLTNVNHSSTVKPDILKISYSFDAIKNELKNRKSGTLTTEYFYYDDNNRLVNWIDPVTGNMPSTNRNIYDVKGRILVNDQVGTIKYENADKIYQATGMTLNNEGIQNYDQDLVQTVLYNENNDPVYISGEKGSVAFQYGLTGMRQRVTYKGIFDPESDGEFTKLYSEEGSFEVVKNNMNGKEKHIIYIEGNPYESNIVFLKNFDENNGSFKFLHKDYLGSILAISDEAGKMLEQRHFDAWGNLTHLQIGNSNLAAGKADIAMLLNNSEGMLIDRGYTGHEHFMEVGIIHMNGRLYDPLLRRFLNADENIQDPFNTQFYNRYGYVVNNPLMYNDPNGEFAWIVVGAVIGGYFTGAKANGSYNPLKWNWGATWGKIAMGAAVGAFTGGVATAVGSASLAAATAYGINGGLLGGAIAGASGGAVAGAINGFATAVMFGEDVIEGTVMGGLSGAAIGGATGAIAGTLGQLAQNAKAAKIGAPQGTILKGAPIEVGRTQWTFNNTPKTTTVGVTPVKTTPIEIGDIGFSTDQYVGTKFVNEQPVKVYEEGPQKIFKGNYASNEGASKTTTSLRKVGTVLESVDDVLANPNLLEGKSYGYVRSILGNSKNWVNDAMRRSSRADGWVLREMNAKGDNFTDKMIQYHPGTPRHFNGKPYWKVSPGNNSSPVRIPVNP